MLFSITFSAKSHKKHLVIEQLLTMVTKTQGTRGVQQYDTAKFSEVAALPMPDVLHM